MIRIAIFRPFSLRYLLVFLYVFQTSLLVAKTLNRVVPKKTNDRRSNSANWADNKLYGTNYLVFTSD